MMKIALVRGPHLNPWEIQTYRPLAEKHQFVVIGADWHLYQKPVDVFGMPVKIAHVWGAALAKISHRAPIVFNRMLSWTTGKSFGLDGLERVLRDFDVLHSIEAYSTMTYQCLCLKKLSGAKLVLTVWENLPGQGETHPLRRWRKRAVLRGADGFLAVTETTRRLLRAEGVPSEKIAVIPMAADASRFSPAAHDPGLRSRLGFSSDDIVVLFIGRLVPEKGVREILQAVPLARQGISGRRVRFCFVGQGPLRREILEAREKHGDAVVHLSFVPYDEIPALHNLADIFLLPSKPLPKWEEQFGYVLIESMLCAKPVITTRSGSIPDVVADAGRFVEPGDPEMLAVEVRRLAQSAELRRELGEKARRRALSTFSLEAVETRLERFYQRVLNGKSLEDVSP